MQIWIQRSYQGIENIAVQPTSLPILLRLENKNDIFDKMVSATTRKYLCSQNFAFVWKTQSQTLEHEKILHAHIFAQLLFEGQKTVNLFYV